LRHISIETYQTVSIDEVEEVFKAMMAQMPPSKAFSFGRAKEEL
jgi:hypothetical protein